MHILVVSTVSIALGFILVVPFHFDSKAICGKFEFFLYHEILLSERSKLSAST